MASDSRKILVQIAFNLLLIILLLIAFVSVLGQTFSPGGDLKEGLLLLVVLVVVLFIGVGFLVRLIRSGTSKNSP